MFVIYKRSIIIEIDRFFIVFWCFDVKCFGFGFGGIKFLIDDGDSEFGFGFSCELVVFVGYFIKYFYKLIYIYIISNWFLEFKRKVMIYGWWWWGIFCYRYI